MKHTIYWNAKYTGAKHAFDTTRKSGEIADAIGHENITDPAHGQFALADADKAIKDVITPDYYEALQCGTPRALAQSNGFTWDYGIWEMALNSTAGVINAAHTALKGENIAGSLSSGLHHADHRSGGGFCTVNGLAVTANFMLQNDPALKIVILDFDAHCGGGTVRTLRHLGIDRQVRQYDISTNTFDDYTEDDTHTVTIAENDDDYLHQVETVLDTMSGEQIDLILYNAGTDPYPNISKEMLGHRDQEVFSAAHKAGTPIAYVLAGGYTWGQTMDELVQSHVTTINKAETQLEQWGTDTQKQLQDQLDSYVF